MKNKKSKITFRRFVKILLKWNSSKERTEITELIIKANSNNPLKINLYDKKNHNLA